MYDRDALVAKYIADLSVDPYEGQTMPFDTSPPLENDVILPRKEDCVDKSIEDLLARFEAIFDNSSRTGGSSTSNNASAYSFEFVPDPADPKEVESLQVKVLENECDYRCCICLDPQNVGDTYMDFTCKHVMHTECSRTWFEYGRTCPLCRRTPWVGEFPP